MAPARTFVICTTPRSGSTLLCALLAASGVGGRPESWFRAEDRAEYEADWAVAPGDSAAFLDAAIRAGLGADGTCGLRIQAVSLPSLMAELQHLFQTSADQLLPDHVLMSRAFGQCHYIHIKRLDDVAQAISRLKAEVSQVWHLNGTAPVTAAARAIYDAGRLDTYRAEASAGNMQWEQWFAANGIAPHRLEYESFATDPAGQVRAVLGNVGLTVPAGTEMTVPNRRMADRESAEWASRYRADRSLPAERIC